MENQNSSYSVQIGKTTFIVCVKQSETAKKPIEKMFKDMCKHEVTRDFLADNLMNLEKLPKPSCRSPARRYRLSGENEICQVLQPPGTDVHVQGGCGH